ncbi:MAG TPA: DNA repair protein RadA [Motilibacteraceae bacterium]|nr:DNA repair protein RadA [Motilibacteraceae bacterium]
MTSSQGPSRGGNGRSASGKSASGRSGKGGTSYRCGECGWTSLKWVGRCGECQAWGSVEEVGAVRVRTTTPGIVSAPARPIGEVSVEAAKAVPTGVDELDRVLGGGMVPGAVVLLAGEPGVGKSTLLLDVASRAAEARRRVLYVSGEESAPQVRLRAERIGALHPELYLAAETDLGAVLAHLDQVEPALLVVDSVQTVASAEIEGAAGGVSQVREVAAALIKAAKERDISTVLVGHVTKDGSIAGPRVLEHLVDVVLHFEGDRHTRLRMVRGVKNRYGPSDEVGCFDLSEDGIVELPDPTGLFTSRHTTAVPGTCVTVAVEGKRPLLAEVQALVAPTLSDKPRRGTTGVDSSRVGMVLAVLSARERIDFRTYEVYCASVGGMRLVEPAADLAIALALASATSDKPLPPDLVAIGEIGLAGEIRRVPDVRRRLMEAARLGFKRALVPHDSQVAVPGMTIEEVPLLSSAVREALARAPR